MIIKKKKLKAKTWQMQSFEFDLPPFTVCRALLKEGQSAMDGGLSFVEQGCESKRPGNEVINLRLAKKY